MRNHIRKVLAMALALCMLVPVLFVAAPSVAAEEAPVIKNAYDLEAEMVGCTAEHVDQLEIAGRDCFVYVPKNPRIGNMLTLTPMVIVFGDEKYTAVSALKAAKEQGFAELATRDGFVVTFVNPIESWDSEADAAAAQDLFAGIFDAYSSRFDVTFVEGKGTETYTENGETKTKTVYPGSLHGLQFFGAGKGADYVAANYTSPKLYSSNYAYQEFSDLPGYPSGIGLFNPSTLTVPELGEGETPLTIPMAIVNGPDNSQAFATFFNEKLGISEIICDETVTGFEADKVIELYDSIISKYYLSQGQFRESPKYREHGIVEVNQTRTVQVGEAAAKNIEYFLYVPDDLDLTKEHSVPLLFWMHGMGGEAEAMLSWSEWPLIAKEYGFMVMSIDQHTNYTADELMALLDLFIEENPYVDTEKLFLSGFSMGSAKTWQMALPNWNRFAGIIPCALGLFGDSPAYGTAVGEGGGILPVFYLAGGYSAMELGSSMFTQMALKYVFKLNAIDGGNYAYDATKGDWGATPYRTTRISYRDEGDFAILETGTPDANGYIQQYLNVDEFVSADGNTYTWLAVNEMKPHTLTNNDAHIVWEKIGKFRRLPDGSITIDEEVKDTTLRDTLTAEMTGNDTERVDPITVGGHDCFMYVPKSPRVGNFLCLTPIVVVFGEEPYTAETALATAQAGFKEIAERDGLCILFVNPIDGWGEEDAASVDAFFADIYHTYTSRPEVKFVNGVGQRLDADNNPYTVYPGSLHGLQFFGIGKSADFIAEHFTTAHLYASNYSYQEFSDLPGFPSGMGLFNPTTLNLPEAPEPVEGEEAPVVEPSLVIPMAIVNGPENAEAYAKDHMSTTGIYAIVNDETVTAFDSALVTKLYDEVIGKYYYSQGQFRECPKYTVNGIIEVNKTVTLDGGKEAEYYEYIPENLDVTGTKNIPLMMWFHGGGGEAEAMSSWTEWQLVAQENGFEVVSLDQHQNFTSAEVIEILDKILAERTYLNPGQVYCGGFSMGGGMTWNEALKHYDRFAGVIPTAAGTVAEGTDYIFNHIKTNSVMPVFYVAGGASFLAELPTAASNNVNNALSFLWDLNRMAEPYTYDATANCRFGVNYSWRIAMPYREKCDFAIVATDEELAVHGFESADGNTYTYLCINKNKPHTLSCGDYPVAWSYMKHFSRTEDGKIAIDGVPVADVPCVCDNFKDVDQNAWYHYAVDYTLTRGLMSGTGDETFEPMGKTTRAMVASMIYRLAGTPEVEYEARFTDVKEGKWFTDAVIWAAKEGIVAGYTDGTFKPNDNVTREMLVSLLYRYADYKKLNTTTTADITGYPDYDKVGSWAAEAMAWGVGVGIISGAVKNGETILNPKGTATRAEIASIFMRFKENVKAARGGWFF